MSRYRTKVGERKIRHLDDYKFDSELELQVYKYLRTVFNKDELIVHDRFLIAPGTAPKYHIYWAYDFYIKPLDLYIEPKGLTTDQAKVRFAFMRNLHPEEFAKIIFITAGRKPKKIIRDVESITLTQLIGLLKNRGYTPTKTLA
jgi:hypothetical protein